MLSIARPAWARLELNNLGIAILLFLLLLSAALTLVLVVVPLLLLRREALRERARRKLRVLGYFLCLGLGFILVEIGFMQKFVLFLGHPIYALAVVLATLLAASGAGSALSGWGAARFGTARLRARGSCWSWRRCWLSTRSALTPLFHALLGLPLAARIVRRGRARRAGPGLLMGALLPTGVRAANAPRARTWSPGRGASTAPPAWSARSLAMSLSMNFGFTIALAVGIAIYLAAMTLLPEPSTAPEAPVVASTTS